MISDQEAADARLVLAAWFVQSGADLSTHFADPQGAEGGHPDPLGIVLARGTAPVGRLLRWVEEQKPGYAVADASPVLQPVRHPGEIQRAHDVLWGIVNQPGVAETMKIDAWEKAKLERSLVALCFVLRHPEGVSFASHLAALEGLAEAAGLRIVEGRLGTGGRIANEDLT